VGRRRRQRARLLWPSGGSVRRSRWRPANAHGRSPSRRRVSESLHRGGHRHTGSRLHRRQRRQPPAHCLPRMAASCGSSTRPASSPRSTRSPGKAAPQRAGPTIVGGMLFVPSGYGIVGEIPGTCCWRFRE
jgi:hypothetical protein